MVSLIEYFNFNSTLVAQIFNFILLTIVPLVVLIYFFHAMRDIKRRVGNIERSLTEIKEQQKDLPSEREN